MSRQGKVQGAFSLRKKVLVGYVTAGYPLPDESFFVELALALHEAGVDILEVGVPFSDPMADGEVIQRAMTGALSNNFGARAALNTIEALKKRNESLPVVVFGYFNPFFQMGLGGLIHTLKDVGADGVLVVDLPIEEGAEWYRELIEHQIEPVYVMPHDFSLKRLNEIAPYARGFLYITSSYAPTGGRIGRVSWLADAVSRAKSAIRLPVAVGFGIQGPEDARAIGEVADGIVVGSALIRTLEAGLAQGGAERAIQEAQSFVRTLKDSLKGAYAWPS